MVNKNLLLAVLIVGFLLFSFQTPTKTPPSSDLSNLIDSGVVFTGQDIYKRSTSTAAEYVRIFKLNNVDKDLGSRSLNSGTLSTTVGKDYRFYFFMSSSPSTTYYVDAQDYNAPYQDSVDNVVGMGCQIDTDLTYATLDGNGNVQTSTANIITMTTSDSKDISLKIKVSADKCYGTEDANKNNAVCLIYNAAAITDIASGAPYSPTPRSISGSTNAIGNSIKCFSFPVIKNDEFVEIPITLTSGSTDPTPAHNITVMSDDIAFDLDADTLEEIWDFTDEDGNQLAASAETLGYIRLQ